MNSIETLATFFGWCTVLDLGIILAAWLFLSIFHDGIGALVAKMFGVREEEAKATFLRIFMQFRVAFVVLNLVPYIALKIMGGVGSLRRRRGDRLLKHRGFTPS